MEKIIKLEAGGEIDALVAEKVMGWSVYGSIGDSSPEFYNKWLEHFRKKESQFLYLDKVGRLWRYAEKLTEAREGELQSEGWSPSTDIQAAFEVVAKIGTGLALHWVTETQTLEDIKGTHQGTGPWLAGMSMLPAVRGETAALAICRMALIAVERESAKK
jgi:hypothetical protein